MFGNVTRNWKTTFSGILVLATSIFGIVQNPSLLTSPEVLAQLVAGIGLIVAKDGSKTGTMDAPRGVQ
jgi:hypothetical protein